MKDNRKLGLCDLCYTCVEWIQIVSCSTCGRAIQCNDCRIRSNTFFTLNRSAVNYNEAMRSYLIQFKYRGDERLHKLFGNMLIHAFHLAMQARPDMKKAKFSLITYVPISQERQLERGFNQTEYLAKALSLYSGIPVVPILKRTVHKDKHSAKKRVHRLEDIGQVFELSLDLLEIKLNRLQRNIEDIDMIFIVDDVYTTGSTINECAKIIKTKINTTICGITCARA